VTQSILACVGIFSCLVAYALYMRSSTASAVNATTSSVTDRTPLPISWENDPSLNYAYVVPQTNNTNMNNQIQRN
jgi:hypothetical protein